MHRFKGQTSKMLSRIEASSNCALTTHQDYPASTKTCHLNSSMSFLPGLPAPVSRQEQDRCQAPRDKSIPTNGRTRPCCTATTLCAQTCCCCLAMEARLEGCTTASGVCEHARHSLQEKGLH